MTRVGNAGCPTGLFVVATLLAACGSKTTQQDATVIATVDGHDLTTADLGQSGESPGMPARETRLTRTAVDSLIDEHLMAQQALTDGLDDDPGVVHELQNARRHILAEALASRLQGRGKPPTAADIEDYYRKNPALFAERRLYSLTLFRIDGGPLSQELLAEVGHASTTNALAGLLGQHSVHFDLQHLERTADELPISQLPQYSASGVGDVLVDATADGATRLIQITGIDLRPSSFESARPAIQRYLAQRDKAAAVEAYLTQARSQARITYHVQEPSPSRTRETPAPPVAHPTIAQGAPNSDAALTALNR